MVSVRIVIFLFPLFPVSNIFAKLINSEKVLRNDVNKCRRFYAVSDKKIDALLNENLIFSELKDDIDLCFLRCVYQMSGFVQDHGLLRADFVTRYLPNKFTPNSAEELNSLPQDRCTLLAENIISVCNYTRRDSNKLCLGAIWAVECFESVLYLIKYGYLNPSNGNLQNFVLSPEVYRMAIIRFQTFFSLSVTGMKWNSRHLTYRISKYSKKIDKNRTDEEILRAFDTWTNVTNLVIENSTNPKADITIRFEKRVHGDRVPFDGPGRILAHTFYPLPVEGNRLNSFIHFDNAEKWTIRSKSGVNLYQIAVHEIGHSLGLKHSNVKDSVMWPRDQGYLANFTLHSDDIDAIQALYGSVS